MTTLLLYNILCPRADLLFICWKLSNGLRNQRHDRFGFYPLSISLCFSLSPPFYRFFLPQIVNCSFYMTYFLFISSFNNSLGLVILSIHSFSAGCFTTKHCNHPKIVLITLSCNHHPVYIHSLTSIVKSCSIMSR